MPTPSGILPGMEPLTELRKAVRALGRAVEREKAAREAVRVAAAEAMRAGVPQKTVAEETGYNRETLRQIARKHELPDGRASPKSDA
jgi:hypothetical protein